MQSPLKGLFLFLTLLDNHCKKMWKMILRAFDGLFIAGRNEDQDILNLHCLFR